MTDDFTWTDQRIEKLKELIADGLSSKQIGMELGCSRNAVIGKVSRLKIVRPARVLGNGKRRVRRTRSERLWDERVVERVEQNRPPQTAPHAKNGGVPGLPHNGFHRTMVKNPEIDLPPDHSHHAKLFIEAGLGECRYPLWTDKTPILERMVCGAATTSESCSWCQRHFDVVTVEARQYRPVQRKRGFARSIYERDTR